MSRNPERLVHKDRLFEDLGYRPHEGQWLVHRSTAPRRVVACGVRWGKSKCAGMEAAAALLAPRERTLGWVLGPTYELSEKVFREIVMVFAEHMRHRIVKLSEHERRLVVLNLAGGTSEVRGKSADNPTSLLGEGLDWVIVDEASRLKPAIWQSYVSQRLIDRRGWAMLISTPAGKNYFYEMFRRGQSKEDGQYESWNFSTWMNPLLDRELIESERERLPARVFAQEFGGEFIEGAGQVFRGVRERALLAAWQEPRRGETYVAGLDLARVEDYTVLVVMNEKAEVVFVDRFTRLDWSLQVARIKATVERYNDALLLVDSTGMGEPVYEQLLQADCVVEPYPLTARSKSELIDGLAIMIEKGTITLPTAELCPEMIDELESFEYSITTTGHFRTGAPSGTHDDCVIALGLAARQAEEMGRPFEIGLVDWRPGRLW